MRFLFSFFILFFSLQLGYTQQVSFVFVGDVMQHGPQIKGAYNSKTDRYEYEHTWRMIQPTIEAADIAIANLEVTHAGKPYTGYPQFSAPDDLSAALKNVGFDVLLTANNHSCDNGSKGVIRTLDVLDSLQILHTGTFRNKEEREKTYPLLIEKNNIKVAILNYTYGTNGLYVKEPLIINYLDSTMMQADFKKAKEMADYIVCTVHWGEEYKSQPNASQKKWENYCYELGADMIIGSHPHVLQPIERKTIDEKEKLTVYSLGNFVSNQRDRYKNGALLVRANIEQKENKVQLANTDYLLAYVHTVLENGFKHYYLIPDYTYEMLDSAFFNATDKAARNLFFSDSRQLMEKYSKNISEYTLQNNATIERFVRGYYAVCVKAHIFDFLSKKIPDTSILHNWKNLDGKEFHLVGYASTEAEAIQNREKIDSLTMQKTESKIVFINRLGLKNLEK